MRFRCSLYFIFLVFRPAFLVDTDDVDDYPDNGNGAAGQLIRGLIERITNLSSEGQANLERSLNHKFSQIGNALSNLESFLQQLESKIKEASNASVSACNQYCVVDPRLNPLEQKFEKYSQEIDSKLDRILLSVALVQLEASRKKDAVGAATFSRENSTEAISTATSTNGLSNEGYKYYNQPRNCADIKTMQVGESSSGTYTIYPMPSVPVPVICDMTTNGGGWTVFQVRGADLPPGQTRTDFFRDWIDYENGFGSVQQDYWLGLGSLAALCALGDCELRVELMDWNGNRRYANYRTFTISGPQDGYRATFKGYVGDAGNGTGIGDALAAHSGMKFTTFDVDNDVHSTNCAKDYKGAWWYAACHHSNLNGVYPAVEANGHGNHGQGLNWYEWRGHYYSMKMTEMKVRSRYLFPSNDATARSSY